MDENVSLLKECKILHKTIGQLNIPLFLSPDTYAPDSWSDVFVEGVREVLTKRGKGQVVVEVGIGSGVAPVYLARNALSHKIERYIGVDLNPVACEVSRINAALNQCEIHLELYGGRPMFDGLGEEEAFADLIVANIPQVACAKNKKVDINNVYPSAADHPLERIGLGLLSEFFTKAKRLLRPGGQILCTVAGRPGTAVIERFFADLAVNFDCVSAHRVPQDRNTDIESLAEFEEEQGFRFEFFPSMTAKTPISASESLKRIGAGEEVYHDLFVYSCTFR